MPTSSKLKTDYFLNRIVLEEMTNVDDINPINALNRIFNFATLRQMLELFQDFSSAALENQFDCKKSDPGSLLYFANRVEEMIEACFPLNRSKKNIRSLKILKQKIPVKGIRLTEKESRNPTIAIEQFFMYKSLPRWKEALHDWIECALSNYSIVERINPNELLPFCEHIEKLMEASYSLCTALPSSKNTLKID